ncbi:rho GTPase-activating protein 20-like isoform X2 [Nerophis lumbriciformis]|uniref:rho GTPase-activating protein 20-like isoform X2 n=1 Tax=Nerophis lumbriciformis TaxID=546530 RepID=UPI002ADF1AB7|nr:rho GTPase-activating protein 20-like isoform X2 [Nerophis lumbriciformis]
MDNMSPQHQQDRLSRAAENSDNRRRMKSQSVRRQSAPALVISKALARSKTLSRESLSVPVFKETCSLVQSFLKVPNRSFLLHGHTQLKTGMQTQDRHLFLFTDILVIAKAKSANQFKQKAQVCVSEMWTASCMEEVCEGSTCPDRSFVLGWPTCNSVATFSSAEQKDHWLALLKRRIKEEKEKEEPKTIPLRVYGKGLNTYAVTKTLPVSNSDSTTEVIRLALQQFSIIGNVKDYQLWILSKRDNTPYPLIGHEFPFSIHMSHARQASSQSAISPEDRERAILAEQLQVHKRCQFILKPRPPEEPLQQQVVADFPQKPLKRRRSLITWAFLRGSSPQLETSTGTTAQGCLFGRPLSAVCVEDTLPKPVMDMLIFLYHEGPWTRGIFRRPAGARTVRELRNSLDAGQFLLPLTRYHIFIIAGVFKDFLRNIPGSLLCCDLHGEWMDVLEEEEAEQERVQEIQRMMGRLPKGNTLLLRHLLAVLQHIHGNAQENQMTSFNLAVCIAPSMLWPPGALCSPEAENEGTRKVCDLVKFMIDQCQQIIGEEPSSLFGAFPQTLTAEEETGLGTKLTLAVSSVLCISLVSQSLYHMCYASAWYHTLYHLCCVSAWYHSHCIMCVMHQPGITLTLSSVLCISLVSHSLYHLCCVSAWYHTHCIICVVYQPGITLAVSSVLCISLVSHSLYHLCQPGITLIVSSGLSISPISHSLYHLCCVSAWYHTHCIMCYVSAWYHTHCIMCYVSAWYHTHCIICFVYQPGITLTLSSVLCISLVSHSLYHLCCVSAWYHTHCIICVVYQPGITLAVSSVLCISLVSHSLYHLCQPGITLIVSSGLSISPISHSLYHLCCVSAWYHTHCIMCYVSAWYHTHCIICVMYQRGITLTVSSALCISLLSHSLYHDLSCISLVSHCIMICHVLAWYHTHCICVAYLPGITLTVSSVLCISLVSHCGIICVMYHLLYHLLCISLVLHSLNHLFYVSAWYHSLYHLCCVSAWYHTHCTICVVYHTRCIIHVVYQPGITLTVS